MRSVKLQYEAAVRLTHLKPDSKFSSDSDETPGSPTRPSSSVQGFKSSIKKAPVDGPRASTLTAIRVCDLQVRNMQPFRFAVRHSLSQTSLSGTADEVSHSQCRREKSINSLQRSANNSFIHSCILTMGLFIGRSRVSVPKAGSVHIVLFPGVLH